MDVLLRTASTLDRACLEAAQRIDVRPTIKLTIHQYASESGAEIRARLNEDAQTAMTNIDQVLALYEARSVIRRLKGIANNDVVDRLLAERDCINLNEKYLNNQIEAISGTPEAISRRRIFGGESVTSTSIQHDSAEVQAALNNARQRVATITTGEVSGAVEVPTLPKAEIQKLKDKVAALRRRRTALNDELAAANLQRHIALPDAIVTVLRRHQIIE